jgi:hypothetical protein
MNELGIYGHFHLPLVLNCLQDEFVFCCFPIGLCILKYARFCITSEKSQLGAVTCLRW